MEQWKAIPGYEGIYEASDAGLIRRIKKSNSYQMKNVTAPYPVAQNKNSRGYMECVLYDQHGSKRTFRVHRLIAAIFLPRPTIEKPEVNHKNLIKTDNSQDNLEYLSRRDNWLHALNFDSIRASIPRGASHWAAKLSEDDVSKIRLMLKQNIPQKQIASLFNVRPNTVSRIKTGSRRSQPAQ